MIEAFHDHSLETSLLTTGSLVLDVGCHGFAFGDLLRKRFKANVYECDLNDLNTDHSYYRVGIAHYEGFGNCSNDLEPQCRMLEVGNRLQVFTVESFRKHLGLPWWDAVKLDCEGSEYDILWNLKEPPATQITVEFHQHTRARRSEAFIDQLVDKLSQWYDVKQHRLYEAQGCGLNYWDSLFVLKGALNASTVQPQRSPPENIATSAERF